MQTFVRRVYGEFWAGRAAWGLLLVRVVFGLAMAQHGWDKIQQPFGWMGPDSPMLGVLQALAALSEFGGGLALAFGFLTPLAALGIAATMGVAVVVAHGGDPWVAEGASKESALGYLAVALMLILTGPGALSLDALLWKRGVKTSNER